MILKPKYRKLSVEEIKSLKSNGCRSESWDRISVLNGFDPGCIRNVTFSGEIKLGIYKKAYTDDNGITWNAGIVNARIHNCSIGSNVVINNIGECIANYTIKDGVVIRNCGRISIDCDTCFGNGTKVNVLVESGGRTVKIWDGLTAQQAYIISFYRHRSKVIKIIDGMIDKYADSIRSDRGLIGRNTVILNCNIIRDVRFGPYSYAEGVTLMNDGSLNSKLRDPVLIGPGVIIEHFVACPGSVITGSSVVRNCFIGQGSVIDRQYSAQDSLFFANFSGYLGEASSIFAGPYTVTHHKSTLLIAGFFSFMNAGSGTNQSNHMYRLGPVHQGILERGSKTASGAYLLWPARIGAFSLVTGRHYLNMDTSLLPFSYLIGNNNESILVPGIGLRSIGTIRDANKWPHRDYRNDPVKTDRIIFDLFSPYTVGKMFLGRDLLRKIRSDAGESREFYDYNNLKIKGHALDRGIGLYQAGIDKFLGGSVIKRLENRTIGSQQELRTLLMPSSDTGKGEWTDLAGLYAPGSVVEDLMDAIEEGKIRSMKMLDAEFERMHDFYNDWQWTWVSGKIREEEGKEVWEFTTADVIRITEKWKKSVVNLDKMLYEDAGKEFSPSTMTGFGIDGDEEIRRQDFEQVRGKFESDRMVSGITEHIEQNTIIADRLIEKMKKLD